MPIRPVDHHLIGNCPSDEELFTKVLSCIEIEIPFDQNGPKARACKDLGQVIFDRYKDITQGDSVKALEACGYIWKGVKPEMTKIWVSTAWIGIGDDNARWGH